MSATAISAHRDRPALSDLAAIEAALLAELAALDARLGDAERDSARLRESVCRADAAIASVGRGT